MHIYYTLYGWNLDGIVFACFDTIHCKLKIGGSFRKSYLLFKCSNDHNYNYEYYLADFILEVLQLIHQTT